MRKSIVIAIVAVSFIAGAISEPVIKNAGHRVIKLINPDYTCQVRGYRSDYYPVKIDYTVQPEVLEKLKKDDLFFNMKVQYNVVKSNGTFDFFVQSNEDSKIEYTVKCFE